MKLLKTLGILVIIVAIFGGAMFGLHFYTEPLIAANSTGAALCFPVKPTIPHIGAPHRLI